jgi:hypothetical protein
MLLLQTEIPTDLQNKMLELHPYNPLAYGALLLLLSFLVFFVYNLYKKEVNFNKELREELKVFNRQFLELLIKVEYKLNSWEESQKKLNDVLIDVKALTSKRHN